MVNRNIRSQNRQMAKARSLLAEIESDPYGQVSPSVYETARLVVAAPWLDGHGERLRYLCQARNTDGSWGPPEGYDVVPTLSATEALLSELRNQSRVDPTIEYGRLRDVVYSGLATLVRRIGPGVRMHVPDTIAAELIIPWLVNKINGHLDRMVTEPLTGLDDWAGARLGLPTDMDDTMLQKALAACDASVLPAKTWHSLEVLGERARQAPSVRPIDGVVCGSPAATASWLDAGYLHTSHPSVQFLKSIQARMGGPVPGVAPITVFERAWVVNTFADCGVAAEIPIGLVDHLHTMIGEFGAPAGRGLPPDSDDTAGALCALASVGSPRSVDSLRHYDAGAHFQCFLGEQTPSTSTNAHILDALDAKPRIEHRGLRWYKAAADIVRWLISEQEPEGYWWDKWHASPYYATMCCALALTRQAAPDSAAAVRKAAQWVRATQRVDGSWGRWRGSIEETAYAMRILLGSDEMTSFDSTSCIARGANYLLRADGDTEHPELWHDKCLYAPLAVVEAARIGALHLALGRPGVRELMNFAERP